MKIKENVIELIYNRKAILALALGLDYGELWMRKVIKTNSENGPLTTLKGLEIIREETGLTLEQIVEEENITA
jgi:hypothetical protein